MAQESREEFMAEIIASLERFGVERCRAMFIEQLHLSDDATIDECIETMLGVLTLNAAAMPPEPPQS